MKWVELSPPKHIFVPNKTYRKAYQFGKKNEDGFTVIKRKLYWFGILVIKDVLQ